MRYLSLLLLALFLIMPVGCSSDDEKSGSQTSKTIKDTGKQDPAPKGDARLIVQNANGDPIATTMTVMAPVELAGQHQVGKEGFQFPKGAKKIAVQAPGYMGRTLSITEGLEEIHTSLLKLATISLTVATPEGVAIPNVRLMVNRRMASPANLLEPTKEGQITPLVSTYSSRHMTDAEGKLRLEGAIPMADYTITPESEGFAEDAKIEISRLAEGSDYSSTLNSTASTWLTGAIQHKDFYRFDGAKAVYTTTLADGSHANSLAMTAPKGEFALPVTPAKLARVSIGWTNDVDGKEYRASRSIAIEEGEVQSLGKLDLVALWVVMGHLTRDGEPMPAASLILRPLIGAHARTDKDGAFRFQGIEKSEIFKKGRKFEMLVHAEGVATQIDVTKAVVDGDLLSLDIDGSARREVIISAVGASEDTTWQIQSLLSNVMPVTRGEGKEIKMKLYPGPYRVWFFSGDSVGTESIILEPQVEGEEEHLSSVELLPGVRITPMMSGLNQATFLIFDDRRMPLGLEALSHLPGRDTEGLQKSWLVPKGKYVVQASLKGRNLTEKVDASEGDQEVAFE